MAIKPLHYTEIKEPDRTSSQPKALVLTQVKAENLSETAFLSDLKQMQKSKFHFTSLSF
jgi:hypothetical protein